MIEQQFRIAEIEVSHSPTDEKILGIFRYEGSGQAKKVSTLLILAEISSTLYAYERLLDVINSTAEQAKYMVAGVEQDPVARFEKLIQRINDAVSTYLEGEPTPLAWNRINLYIIELSPDHICLTGVGRLMNVFLQKQPDASFKTFDLFGSLEQLADINPQKPFASLICGDMKPGDVLMAGTTNMERLRNELRIKERLTTLPPVSAALEIKQDLESRGIPDDFIGAVVACCALEMPTAIAEKITNLETDKSTASVNKMREAEEEVSHHLSPAIAPSKTASLNQTKVKQLMAKAQEIFKRAKNKIVDSDRTRDVAALANLRGMNAGHGSFFTKKHRFITIGAAAVLIIGIAGFSFWKRSQRLAGEETLWQTTFEQAQDNRNRAESDLVYANDSRARKSIETAEQLLSKLDVSKDERAKQVTGLKNDLQQLRERLRKIIVAQPVTELAALSGAPEGSLTAPILVKDTAYAVDNSSKTILKVDVATKTTKRISLPANTDNIVAGSLGKQSIVFMTGKGKLFAVDIKTDAVTSLASQPHSSSTTDIVLYAGRSYVLDGINGQIWRAQSGTAGFGTEQAYIKASTLQLNNSVSLAIDSNVYVLKSDGTLARFLSGGQEGFTLSTIDPPLRASSGIWTVVDGTRIAITDPAEKRVVVFNKDGTLKAQITSPDFSGPRDVDGDETTKRLLIIDGTRLLLIPLP